MSSFLLPPLGSYTSSTGLGSPCLGSSTGSIQPGTEKTGIFIENAASLFLLSKTEYRTTPHVGGDAGTGSSSTEWEMTGQQHRDLVQAHSMFIKFQDFSLPAFKSNNYTLRISTSEFDLSRFKTFKGALWIFLVNKFLFIFSESHQNALRVSSRPNQHGECFSFLMNICKAGFLWVWNLECLQF